jgi:predicted component of type VI protein secretion system
MLYYVLGSVGDSSNKTDYIHRVASQYFEVPEFAKALTGAWSRVYVQQGNDKWNQGTVLGPEWASGSKMIGELLEKGWRF